MFLQKGTLKISIDFPALDNLVAFLRENDQQQIDAVTAQVGDLSKQLKESSDDLRKAVADEQK